MSLQYGKGKIFYCSFRGADNWKLNVSCGNLKNQKVPFVQL